MTSDLERLSRLMSLVLRHEPERFGLILDAEGFASLAELVEVLRANAPGVGEAEVRAVVATVDPQKQRFLIDGDEIRANYGHSIPGRIRHELAVPPVLLFHGTHVDVLATILSGGLKPMRRQYVHLTVDADLALRVGSRRGAARLVRVRAAAAHGDGIPFYRANEAFWLADQVPARYLEPVD